MFNYPNISNISNISSSFTYITLIITQIVCFLIFCVKYFPRSLNIKLFYESNRKNWEINLIYFFYTYDLINVYGSFENLNIKQDISILNEAYKCIQMHVYNASFQH